MQTSTKYWLIGGGATAIVGGIVWWGLRKKGDAVMEPTYEASKQLSEADKAVFEQGIMRIAMTKATLDKATMDQLYAIAIKAGLPKTAMMVRSILMDGKPGGPNYAPPPTDELWPGLTISVRAFISQEMKKLKAGVA